MSINDLIAAEAAASEENPDAPLKAGSTITRGHSRAKTLQIRLNDDELAAGIELPVLAAALAARAGLQRDLLPRHAEDLARGGQRLVEAATLHVQRDFRRRGVFLHV